MGRWLNEQAVRVDMRRVFPTILLSWFLVGPSYAELTPVEDIYYNRGYQKADAYLEMSEELRRAYVTGVFDGFMGATFIGGDFRIVQSLVICFEGVITGELFDLVELYLRQHPEMKRYSMNAIMRNVVDRECFQ